MKVKSDSEVAQSCPTRSDPMDCSLPGSSVHGVFQARVLEWSAIAFSCKKAESLFTYKNTEEREKKCVCVCVLVTQVCSTLCDPMDCSLPGFSVHEILQTRILEWVAMPFARGSSQPKDQTQVSCTAGRFFTI